MATYGRFELEDGTIAFARVDGLVLTLLDQAPWLGDEPSGRQVLLSKARRLCPVMPSKILCIGRNYVEHAKELGNAIPTTPLVFLKPPSSLIAHEQVVMLPVESERVEYEAELGVVVGRRGRRISLQQAMDYVFGYTVVVDVTARDLQRRDGQWARAKGFDTFCPVGPEIRTDIDPGGLELMGRVNGQVRQQGNTRDMVFGVGALVSYLSQAMTLEPGDLIATGTPAGVGPLVDGDRFEAEVQNVGVLSVSVRKESDCDNCAKMAETLSRP